MFGLLVKESRASLNDPRYTLDDLVAYPELFGGGTSDAGIIVTKKAALGLDPVWQATTMVPSDIAKLPLDLFARGDNGARDVDQYHPAWYLVAREANEFVNSFVFWRRLIFHAMLWGNGYAWIDRNGRGDPIGLYNLLPDRTGPEVIGGRLYYATETSRADGTPYLPTYEARDILHLQGPGFELWEGADPTSQAKNSFGLGLANQKFTSKFFKHGVRAGGVLEIPVGTTPKAAGNLEEGFKKHHTTEDGWFKTVILRDGAKFHQTSIPPNEAQNVETMEAAARNAARRFNMAPSLLGVIDSHGYGSKQDDTQAYLDRTLSPWMRGITLECFAKLLSQRQKYADSHYFEFNVGALLTMNMLQRYQVYAIGLRNKVLVPNEARGMENLNPMPGGDKFLEAYGAGKQGTAGDNQTNQHTGDNPAGSDPAKEDKKPKPVTESKASRMRFVFKLTERARHKSRSGKSYCEWLDGGLASFLDDAGQVGIDRSRVTAFRDALQGAADIAKSDQELLQTVEALAEAFETQMIE